jgi:hypothetical protein
MWLAARELKRSRTSAIDALGGGDADGLIERRVPLAESTMAPNASSRSLRSLFVESGS